MTDFFNTFGVSFDKDRLVVILSQEFDDGYWIVSDKVARLDTIKELIEFVNADDSFARVVVDEPGTNVTNALIKGRRYVKLLKKEAPQPYLTKRVFLDDLLHTQGFPNVKSELLFKFRSLVERNLIGVPQLFLEQAPRFSFIMMENGNYQPSFPPNTMLPAEFRAFLITLTPFPLRELLPIDILENFLPGEAINYVQMGYKERKKLFKKGVPLLNVGQAPSKKVYSLTDTLEKKGYDDKLFRDLDVGAE